MGICAKMVTVFFKMMYFTFVRGVYTVYFKKTVSQRIF